MFTFQKSDELDEMIAATRYLLNQIGYPDPQYDQEKYDQYCELDGLFIHLAIESYELSLPLWYRVRSRVRWTLRKLLHLN